MTDEAIRTRVHDNTLTVAEACKVLRDAQYARTDYGDILTEEYMWSALSVDADGKGAAENWMRVEEALAILKRSNELIERRR